MHSRRFLMFKKSETDTNYNIVVIPITWKRNNSRQNSAGCHICITGNMEKYIIEEKISEKWKN